MKAKFKRTYKLLQAAENVGNLGNARILAGWIRPEQKHGETPTAHIAHILEYGATINVTPKMRGFFAAGGLKSIDGTEIKAPLKKSTTVIKIPPRPMLRFTGKDKWKDWVKAAGEIAKAVTEGKTDPKKAYNQLGLTIVKDIQHTIDNSSLYIPNAPLTQKIKEKNTPLIDTGEMRDQVDYKVTKK